MFALCGTKESGEEVWGRGVSWGGREGQEVSPVFSLPSSWTEYGGERLNPIRTKYSGDLGVGIGIRVGQTCNSSIGKT